MKNTLFAVFSLIFFRSRLSGRVYLNGIYFLLASFIPGGVLFAAALKYPERGLEYVFLLIFSFLLGWGAVRVELAALGRKNTLRPAWKRRKNILFFSLTAATFIFATDWLSRYFTMANIRNAVLFWGGVIPLLLLITLISAWLNLLLARLAAEKPETEFFQLARLAAKDVRYFGVAAAAIQIAGVVLALAVCAVLMIWGFLQFIGAGKMDYLLFLPMQIIILAAGFEFMLFSLVFPLYLISGGEVRPGEKFYCRRK